MSPYFKSSLTSLAIGIPIIIGLLWFSTTGISLIDAKQQERIKEYQAKPPVIEKIDEAIKEVSLRFEDKSI
jgi:predicted peroxiredoxin